MSDQSIPFIDPRVKHVGCSKLREFNGLELAAIGEDIFVIEGIAPLAVLMSYEMYLKIQAELLRNLETK